MSTELLQLRVGEERALRLPGRGTAGYGWLPELGGEIGVLSVAHGAAPLDAAASDPPRSGSVDEVFVLRGLSPGRAILHLELRRRWDPHAAAIDVRDYEIAVVPAR